MYEISYARQFERDLKLIEKRGYKTDLLRAVVKQLQESGILDPHYRTHKLLGQYSNYLECHIKSDWLLIWKQNNDTKKITLTRTGTHSDLF